MPALIPDAATYGTQQAYAQQAYDKAKANIQSQQQGWLKQYGMTANYDQNSGQYNNYHVDPYNSYGLIQQNRNAEALDLNAAQDNAISRGIGGPGLGNQAASSLKFQHGVQDQNLGNTFMQGMGGYGQNLNDAATTFQQAQYQAEMNALQVALANQDFQTAPDPNYTDNYVDNSNNNDSNNNNNDNNGEPTVFQQQLMDRGFTQKQTKTLDPGIAAAILASTKKQVAKSIAKSKGRQTA